MKKIIIPVSPQTHVRVTQGDSILFRIPRYKLRKAGLARLTRIERYNDYKEEICVEARRSGFKMPSQGLCVRFFIPMPKTWRNWQKELMDGKLHQGKPDLDNLLKAFMDSLMSEDKHIGSLSEVSKLWVNEEKGWIELSVKPQLYPEADCKIRPPKVMGLSD